VALEYTSLPPVPLPDVAVSGLTFADSAGNTTNVFPADTVEVQATFNYSGFENEQLFVGKIYVDDDEDLSLRIVDEWSQGSAGTTQYAISVGEGSSLLLLDGDYILDLFLGWQLVATANFTVGSDDTADVVTASDTDGETVTYELPEIGLSLSTPVDWFALEQADSDLYFTSDPTDTEYIYIYLLEDAPTDPQGIALEILDVFAMDSTGDGITLTVDERDVYAFGLTYNDGEVWNGRAFAYYDGASGTGVVVSAEVPAVERDPDTLFESLLTWVSF
ncbi:MAG: hypothetical protein AAF787_04805, partial [Chloroflexota bacterium]